MIVRIKKSSNQYREYLNIVYYADDKVAADAVDMDILSHGNAKPNEHLRPYIRTSQNTLYEEDLMLSQGHTVSEVYDAVLINSGGPLHSQYTINGTEGQKTITQ